MKQHIYLPLTPHLLSGPEHPIVVELVASATPKELHEHYERAGSYGSSLGAEQVWVLHFTASTNEQPTYKAPSQTRYTVSTITYVYALS